MSRAYVALGANLGDREGTIRKAVALLREVPDTTVTAISSLVESEAVGEAGQPDYLNGVVRLETAATPRRLLWHLLLIEARLGRERRRGRQARPLDLDLLLFDDLVVEEPDLALPHPRLLDRAFVLVPLLEIEPDLVHPRLGRPIAELSRERPPSGTVRPFDPVRPSGAR